MPLVLQFCLLVLTKLMAGLLQGTLMLLYTSQTFLNRKRLSTQIMRIHSQAQKKKTLCFSFFLKGNTTTLFEESLSVVTNCRVTTENYKCNHKFERTSLIVACEQPLSLTLIDTSFSSQGKISDESDRDQLGVWR